MTKYICPAKGGVNGDLLNLCPREEITNLCCASCGEILCGGEHTCLKIKAQREAGENPVSCGTPVEG
ncbi:hypothetical protein [Geopsychrobacter electrodiphilus]|uniref:hypothetical protein n=1 Tax=Geopsychrobacter electrodiphilus TaxID=225196 RepID=UPI0003656B89|nr:hypothetical protein [Geopsychrobacter electrodiphilus]